MKKSFLLLVFSLVAVFGFARPDTDYFHNPKYAAGAVPVVGGKVVFSYDIETGFDENATYKRATDWAMGRFVEPKVLNSHVLQKNSQDKLFKLFSAETMVFKKSAFVTDFTKISYTTVITVKGNVCNISFTDIVYNYNENRPEVEATEYAAEDWITDAESINKGKTKFLKKTGKFRVATIDLFSNLSEELKAAFEL